MVVGAFPLAKFGFLLLKQLSKPIAAAIKNGAKTHPFFRKYVCVVPANAYHWCEMQMKLHVKGRWKPVTVVPMTEEEAVDLGSNLLGEVVLFTLLSGILLFELNRQGDKKAEKEKVKEDEIGNLIETVITLVHDVQELQDSVKDLKKVVNQHRGYDIAELEEILAQHESGLEYLDSLTPDGSPSF